MTKEFKKGDRVKYVTEDSWGDSETSPLWGGKEGKIVGTITSIDGDSDDVEFPINIDWDNGENDAFHGDNLEHIKGVGRPRKEQPTVYKFALQYELDEDPTEYFTTLAEAKKRIRELASDATLKRDKIFIHSIKKTQKVELGVSISLK